VPALIDLSRARSAIEAVSIYSSKGGTAVYRRDICHSVRDRIIDAEVKKLELRQAQARVQQANRPLRPLTWPLEDRRWP
jgi:hypothetical protein